MEKVFDWEQLLYRYRYPVLILLLGFILAVSGILFFKKDIFSSRTKIEILENTGEVSGAGTDKKLTVEISGAVENPGVFKMDSGSRVDDLLIKAGGFSGEADRVWTDKYLNRAAVLLDGQKIYIPVEGSYDSNQNSQSDIPSANKNGIYQSGSPQNPSDSNAKININTASLNQLDSLPGIGPVYGQNIIEHRPYSNTSELLSKNVLKPSVYEKIKDRITIY